MATTNGNRPILDLKRWEMLNPTPVASGVATATAYLNCKDQQVLIFASNTFWYLYNINEDAFIRTPTTISGSFGAGSVVVGVPWSTGSSVGVASLSATAGTSTTLTTNLTLIRDLRGYQIQILGGPGSGDIKTIASNTIGSNAVITVTSAFSATPTTSTTYRLLTPRWFLMNAGALAVGNFVQYDFATGTRTNVSQTNLPATISFDSNMISTSCYVGTSFISLATGTSTGANTSTTLNNTGKNWTANQWTNMQIRITGGTGAGQIRTISSNTATAITVSSAWTTTPDNTSTYALEGNDDHIYYRGSNTGTIYRYSISGNTWTALAAAATNPSTGIGGGYFYNTGDATWAAEDAIINGRRIYYTVGGGTSTISYYDIPSNTWSNGIAYSTNQETFSAGTSYAVDDSFLYIQLDNTGRWVRFNPVTSSMDAFSTISYTQGTGQVGNRAWIAKYVDGATTLRYVYFWLNTSSIMMRALVI